MKALATKGELGMSARVKAIETFEAIEKMRATRSCAARRQTASTSR
ncbi:hypothetical protein [Ensifer canadensis]